MKFRSMPPVFAKSRNLPDRAQAMAFAQAWARQAYDSRREFLKRALVVTVIVAALGQAGWEVLKRHWNVAWDGQINKCLPWTFMAYAPKDDQPVRRGDLVRIRLPKTGTAFDGWVAGKLVAGLPGDKVIIKNNFLIVNNQPWGWLWLINTLKKPSGFYDREYIIPAGHVLLLGTEAESYDGRYWGPLPLKAILSHATPLY